MAAFAATSTMTSQSLSGASLRPCTPQRVFAAAPRQRTVTVTAQKAEGPSDAAMKSIGLLAAAQMALLPFAGAAMADLIPETAKSEGAREAANRKLDNVPTLGDVGRSLAGEADNVNAPDLQKQADKGADKAQSAVKEVTKGSFPNPARDFANRAKQAVSDVSVDQAANKAKSAVKDVAKGSIPNPARDFANKAKQAVSSVSSNPAANTLSLGNVGANPAQQFANKSKAVVNKAKAATVPDPIEALKAKTKEATSNVKAVSIPNPAKDLTKQANKAKAAIGNPAADFANQANKAKSGAKKVQSKVVNPAKEFANRASSKKVGLLSIGFDTTGLQKNVLFGIGEKKAQKVADTVKSGAQDVASDAGDAAKDVASDAAKKVDESTPNSFSIFDASSVNDARQKLKANLDEAVNSPSDPAERVASVGKPGESQEENAERIRREAENGNVEGGDARAPTN